MHTASTAAAVQSEYQQPTLSSVLSRQCGHVPFPARPVPVLTIQWIDDTRRRLPVLPSITHQPSLSPPTTESIAGGVRLFAGPGDVGQGDGAERGGEAQQPGGPHHAPAHERAQALAGGSWGCGRVGLDGWVR